MLHVISEEIENISLDLVLPKTKPISTVYKPPTDNHFLDYLYKWVNDFNLMENDLFILGNTDINTLNNGQKASWININIWVKENLILVLFLKSMHRFVLLYNAVLGFNLIIYQSNHQNCVGFYHSRPNKIQWSITKYTFRTRTSDVRIRLIPSINNARESSILKSYVQQDNMLNLGAWKDFCGNYLT